MIDRGVDIQPQQAIRDLVVQGRAAVVHIVEALSVVRAESTLRLSFHVPNQAITVW